MHRTALLFLVACTSNVETATISPLRTPCQTMVPTTCLELIHDDGAIEEVALGVHGGIDGYEHVWGVQAKVRFHREPIDPPLVDAPREQLFLDEVLSENTRINGLFTIVFPANGIGWFLTLANSELSIDGNTTIGCDDPAVCQELLATDDGAMFGAVFELTSEPNKLTVLGVL